LCGFNTNITNFKGTIYRLPHVNTIYGRNSTFWVDGTLRFPSNNCFKNTYDMLFKRQRQEVPMLGSIQILKNNTYKPTYVITNYLSGHMFSFIFITHVPSTIEIGRKEIIMNYDKNINLNTCSKLRFNVVNCLNEIIYLKNLQKI
jgi:hypothetical protein